jgi:hypothetical protein
MRTPTKIVLGLLIAAVVVLVLALAMKGSAPLPQPPLPVPNGYDDFVRATKVHEGDSDNVKTFSAEELRAFVGKNSNALELIRLGLSRQCQVPINFSSNAFVTFFPDLAQVKSLAYVLWAVGRLAEMEKRTNDAIKAYLDTIRFGHESMRGGVLIHKLVGVAIESLGMQSIQRLAANLDAQQCRDTIQGLEQIEAASESADTILEREDSWRVQSAGHGVHRITTLLALRLMNIQATQQRSINKCQAQERSRRVLLLDLAVRAYELERGRRPKELADLVPVYLKAIPQDPFTATNLSYSLR